MRSSKLLLGAGLFAILVVLFIYMAGGFTEKVTVKPVQNEVTTDLNTVVVKYTEEPQLREFTGTVIADQQAQLSARVTAKVLELTSDVGDVVTKGEILIRLESDDLDARVKQSEQRLSSAQASMNAASKEYKRVSELVKKKLLPQSEFDRVESQLESAKASFKQSQAALKEAQTTFDYSVIRAPFDGVITTKAVGVGDTAIIGAPLMTLYNPQSLQLEVNVSESLISRVKLGTELQLELPTSHYEGKANVVEISPSADQSSRSFVVKLALSNNPSIYPGVYGKVFVFSHKTRVLSVPENALYQVGQLDYVKVYEEGKLKTQLVQLGQGTQVRKGLKEGDSVVINPLGL
ncbi:efflux RND transporter periplasmic adaptor subunit [Vibrio sp. vnigr-6D03]|uniref:efflux RND transporter periplasmic adaptor subunit n=1 Tax=Vibrio sp. vnigr-6D03 TaxID=2058088 RepID=UPI000C31EEDE|nr:efflux RND transporter periplasmic adaptor subunit [Vibrio sp. vnigr-6D03]PKF76995.1 efflux RND transporter periplasmic adaptor subunit [Vibrio sp. vnigr-6D03]